MVSKEVSPLIDKIVILAASLGGPPLVNDILSGLVKDFSMPVVVLQQMESDFSEPLTAAWSKTSVLKTVRLQQRRSIYNGEAYVIPYGMCPMFERKEDLLSAHSQRCGQEGDVSLQWGSCFKNCADVFAGQVILIMLTNAALKTEELKSDLLSLQKSGGTIVYCRESQEVSGSFSSEKPPVSGYLEMEIDQIVSYLNKLSASPYQVPEAIPDFRNG